MGKWDQNNNKIHQQRTVIIIKNNDYKTKINKQNFNTKFIFLKQKQKKPKYAIYIWTKFCRLF